MCVISVTVERDPMTAADMADRKDVDDRRLGKRQSPLLISEALPKVAIGVYHLSRIQVE